MSRPGRNDRLLLAHGDGGKLTDALIREVFAAGLGEAGPEMMDDAALLPTAGDVPALTTDTFTVNPYFFPGGDIGKLAVAGTVNDLAVMGAVPRYLTAGFILEEGLPLTDLAQVVESMGRAAREAGVRVVAGDTKVVERGKGDGIYVNTTGLGYVPVGRRLGTERIRPSDTILINGGIAEHGTAVLSRRAGLQFETAVVSDCAPLNGLIEPLLQEFPEIHFLRDPTRGGLATTLKEIAAAAGLDFHIEEEKLPVQDGVRGPLEFLGLDPLYLANEGKVIILAPSDQADAILTYLREQPLGRQAAEIGEVRQGRGDVYLHTPLGGTQRLDLMSGQPLPRIC